MGLAVHQGEGKAHGVGVHWGGDSTFTTGSSTPTRNDHTTHITQHTTQPCIVFLAVSVLTQVT